MFFYNQNNIIQMFEKCQAVQTSNFWYLNLNLQQLSEPCEDHVILEK